MLACSSHRDRASEAVGSARARASDDKRRRHTRRGTEPANERSHFADALSPGGPRVLEFPARAFHGVPGTGVSGGKQSSEVHDGPAIFGLARPKPHCASKRSKRSLFLAQRPMRNRPACTTLFKCHIAVGTRLFELLSDPVREPCNAISR